MYHLSLRTICLFPNLNYKNKGRPENLPLFLSLPPFRRNKKGEEDKNLYAAEANTKTCFTVFHRIFLPV
jgi:hypothetical protein